MREVPNFHKVEPRLRLEHFPPVNYTIRNVLDAVAFCYDNILKESHVEKFVCIYLDAQLHPVCYTVISIGTESKVYASTKEVLTPALLYGVSRIICLHNHPTGNSKPSPQDRKFSYELYNKCREFDLFLVDSIVCACCSDEKIFYTSISQETDENNPWERNRQCKKQNESIENFAAEGI